MSTSQPSSSLSDESWCLNLDVSIFFPHLLTGLAACLPRLISIIIMFIIHLLNSSLFHLRCSWYIIYFCYTSPLSSAIIKSSFNSNSSYNRSVYTPSFIASGVTINKCFKSTRHFSPRFILKLLHESLSGSRCCPRPLPYVPFTKRKQFLTQLFFLFMKPASSLSRNSIINRLKINQTPG